MKVACFLVPHLPVQVERRLDDALSGAAVVVGGRAWDAGTVVDCCSEAASVGVRVGMSLAQAEKLCPRAHFVPAREPLYRAAHEALIAAAEMFTGRIETARLGQLFLDAAGLERRFGSDTRVVRELACEAERAAELVVQVGLGSGKFVAEQAARAARSGKGCVVPPGETRVFLSALPFTVLPADPEMQQRLHMLGVRTLGALAALPRLAVVRQFGAQAGPLHDLARGCDPRPVRPGAPPLALERRRSFLEPLSEGGALLAHADQMMAELAERLSTAGLQAEKLWLGLEDEVGEHQAKGAIVKPPSADGEKLLRLAERLLGQLAPACAVVELSLVAYPVRPFHLGATQLALFENAPDTRRERLYEVLRRLRERFGEMIIMVASLVAPPPPRPVQVTTDPAGLPRALIWQDRIDEVSNVYEVWRMHTSWWRLPVERDYYRLETAGGQVRVVFHDLRRGRWLQERRCI